MPNPNEPLHPSEMHPRTKNAPYAIQEFKLAAEDALFREQAREYYLGDGVADLIDGARVWAGSTPITERGKEIWTKRVTIVERALRPCAHAHGSIFRRGLAAEPDRCARPRARAAEV